MKNNYSIDEERMIAEHSEMIVRGLTLRTVSDNDATKAHGARYRFLGTVLWCAGRPCLRAARPSSVC
jgi:hypothetical protein